MARPPSSTDLLCRAARPRAARVLPTLSGHPSAFGFPGNHIPGLPGSLEFALHGARAARDLSQFPALRGLGALPQLQGTGRGIVGSGGTAAFAIVAENHAVLGTANADGILQQRPKDALEVERCPA